LLLLSIQNSGHTLQRKQMQNRLTTDTCQLNKLPSQLNQLKQSWRLAKFKQSKPGKPHSWGLANSVKSIQFFSCNSNTALWDYTDTCCTLFPPWRF